MYVLYNLQMMLIKLGDVITRLQSRDCKPLGFLIGKALQRDNNVGDFLIVRISRFCMFVASFQCKALAINIWNLLATLTVSKIHHQHRCDHQAETCFYINSFKFPFKFVELA